MLPRGEQSAKLAEREGFEPPVGLLLHLISSQAHSTRLWHLSAIPLVAPVAPIGIGRAGGGRDKLPAARAPGQCERAWVPLRAGATASARAPGSARARPRRPAS